MGKESLRSSPSSALLVENGFQRRAIETRQDPPEYLRGARERQAAMTQIQEISPLEQARLAKRVKLADSDQQLSRDDQAILKRIFEEKYEYVENEAFPKSNAKKKIFDEAPEIQKPDTSWYHPVMENVGDQRGSKNAGTVLLTAAEERALFLQYNYCRYKVCKLRDRIGTKLIKAKQARELLDWYKKAEAYCDQIAQTNLALVLAMAKRTRSEVDFGDLISEGNMALLRAIDKFDVARGFKFSTYGCRAILKAFSRIGVKQSRYKQLVPTDFDPKLERSNYMELKRQSHKEDCVEEVAEIIRDNRAALTDIEQEVIEHRFALGDKQKEADANPMTLEQVGRIIGVTKERVRQIQNKALDKIKVSLERNFLA